MGVLFIKDRTYNWDMMVDRVQKGSFNIWLLGIMN